mmetsp:Transcript_23953/g.59930  ORF Transcript_23953/g.59930 Transcript_23953/m.59930 type:complete len:169 (+) Transcript_23953:173-679(+)
MDELDRRLGDLAPRDDLANCARRVLFSPAYMGVCLLMILINLSLLYWIIQTPHHQFPDSWNFIVLEVLVNVGFTLELLLRYLSMPGTFWNSLANKLDVAVLLVCLLAAFSAYAGTLSAEIAEEYSDLALLLRYGVQAVRLMVFMKNRGASLSSSIDDEVDLSRTPMEL